MRRGLEQLSLCGGDRNVLWLLHGLFRLGQRYREDPVLVNRLDLVNIYRVRQGHTPAVHFIIKRPTLFTGWRVVST